MQSQETTPHAALYPHATKEMFFRKLGDWKGMGYGKAEDKAIFPTLFYKKMKFYRAPA
ncbi:MAG: hypothetical protein Q4G66_01100 [bacterium]|nr:hypothetical protein [bacterium]